jgi:hypothetical protein
MARGRQTEEERKLAIAQAEALRSQAAQAAADTAAKMRIAQAEIEQRREAARAETAQKTAATEAAAKQGTAEVGQRERQSRLTEALNVLSQGSKERIEAMHERGGIASDLTKVPNIDQRVLANALAESGQPGLYNAFARQDVEKRRQLINQLLPGIKSAKSDTEREQKYKPQLEAASPGAYKEALALAFPKEGQEVPETKPALWSGDGASSDSSFRRTMEQNPPGAPPGSLANTLLEKAGVIAPTVAAAPATEPVPTHFQMTSNFAYYDPSSKANYFYDTAGRPRVGGAGDPSVGALKGSTIEQGSRPGEVVLHTPTGGTITSSMRERNKPVSFEQYAQLHPEYPVTGTLAGAKTEPETPAGGANYLTGRQVGINQPPQVPLITTAPTPAPTWGETAGKLVTPAATPAPAFGLSFNNQPIPISVGVNPGVSNAAQDEAERQRRLAALAAVR